MENLAAWCAGQATPCGTGGGFSEGEERWAPVRTRRGTRSVMGWGAVTYSRGHEVPFLPAPRPHMRLLLLLLRGGEHSASCWRGRGHG